MRHTSTFIFGSLLAVALAGCPPQNPVNNPGMQQPSEMNPSPLAGARMDEVRAIDGAGNNRANPGWGAADSLFLRITFADYIDGADAPWLDGRPNPRDISNACVAQSKDLPNPEGITDLFWQWGQFIDHDIDLAPVFDPAVPLDIAIPAGDTWFDPFDTGAVVMGFARSYFEYSGGVAQQLNEITAFVDASNVYGSNAQRQATLRANDGTGQLKTSAGDLLPFNTSGLPNAPDSGADYFLAGDFRANEQVGLTAMHTLFMREHNFWARRMAEENPQYTENQLYDMARAIVAGEVQFITYNEFLPVLLGNNALPAYRGYRTDVNAGISNEFATAAYRFGHTMLSDTLLRLDGNKQPIAAGNIALADAFFNPRAIIDTGIEPLLRGLANQVAQTIDPYIVDGVRNFLFGPPGSGGFDLACLNIQRGRDHGLPPYNDVREALGLGRVNNFGQITRDADIQTNLEAVYGSVDLVDLWVGGLAEDHVPGALVGPTFHTILRDQFLALRDGDRFWYARSLSPDMVDLVERQSLAGIIHRNTNIRDEISDHPFRLAR